jgi:dTDP-4-dehydrorhamnose reductase
VGHALRRELATLGRLHCPDRATLDLRDAESIRRTIRQIDPALIVNAAAYTAVDKAEGDGATLSHAINAEAPAVIAEEAARSGAMLMHFSTDYVFDGRSTRPYTEGDETNPVNTYGRTKLQGEKAILATDAQAMVFRLGWVYDLQRANFLTTMRRLAGERDELRVVADQVGIPTWSGSVAAAVAQIAASALHPGPSRDSDSIRGVYHLAGSGQASWAEFAAEILRVAPVPGRAHVRVTPIATEQFPTPARRPAYSVMDSALAQERFGVRLPHWKEQLEWCVRGDA